MIQKKIILLLGVIVAHLASATFFICSSRAADVMVSIGDGTGTVGSGNNKVTVFLDNADRLRGLQLVIYDEGNFLACSACQAVERASSFTCYANEHRFGYTTVQLFSSGASLITEGSGPVLILSFEVRANASPGQCTTLTLTDKNSSAADENKKPIAVKSMPGEFCITGGGADQTTTAPATTTTGAGTTDNQESAPASTPNSISNVPLLSDGRGIVPAQSDDRASNPQTSDDLEQEVPATPRSSRRVSTATSINAQASQTPQQGTVPQDRAATTTALTTSPYRLIISPSVVELYSGDMIRFGVKTLREGDEVEGRYAWQLATPSIIGSTISETGEFIAGSNSTETPVLESVYVTDTLNDNSTEMVLITVDRLDQAQEDCLLKASPASATIQPGETISFSVRTIGTVCKEGSYAWRLNSTIGSRIDEKGHYTAGANQSGHNALDIILVKDVVNGLSTDAIITVLVAGPAGTTRSEARQTPRFTGSYFYVFVIIVILAALLGIALMWKFKR